jgi:hypothetical protein
VSDGYRVVFPSMLPLPPRLRQLQRERDEADAMAEADDRHWADESAAGQKAAVGALQAAALLYAAQRDGRALALLVRASRLVADAFEEDVE